MELFGNNLKHYRGCSGFTLIELLFVLGIFTLLIVASIPSYHAIKENVALKNSSNEIIRALRKAQNDSVIAMGGTGHGVHFASAGYTIFEGNDWATGKPVNEYQLVAGIKIISGENSDVIFDRLTGKTSCKTIEIGLSDENKKIIAIDETGRINVGD